MRAASASRLTASRSDQTDQAIEADGRELGAIYHSHTHTAPYPSQTDINFAANWPGLEWVIVGLADRDAPEVRSYLIEDGQRPRGGAGAEDERLEAAMTVPYGRGYPAASACTDCAMPLLRLESTGPAWSGERHAGARSSRNAAGSSSSPREPARGGSGAGLCSRTPSARATGSTSRLPRVGCATSSSRSRAGKRLAGAWLR